MVISTGLKIPYSFLYRSKSLILAFLTSFSYPPNKTETNKQKTIQRINKKRGSKMATRAQKQTA
jgi:hypothetical protein